MENVKSNRCKAEPNECKGENTFPYAILRALGGTESVSTRKSSDTHTVGYFCSPTKTLIFLRGYTDTEQLLKFLRQNTRM